MLIFPLLYLSIKIYLTLYPRTHKKAKDLLSQKDKSTFDQLKN
ncbi:hypothetical protein SAMN04488101_11637 [Pedobacter nyackensis]|uniref:Uncharacterized protein n=1 Tax=Pedobacter nyackensis TaxID=475255 RepID=A0A1W2EU66_9SPHI|nr:hypothetical protein SAMN04488101_11637 [Pedobacter nyackensis]